MLSTMVLLDSVQVPREMQPPFLPAELYESTRHRVEPPMSMVAPEPHWAQTLGYSRASPRCPEQQICCLVMPGSNCLTGHMSAARNREINK